MKKQIFLILMLLTIGAFGQNYRHAIVKAIIPFGQSSYAVLEELNTSNYFKTSPFPHGDLSMNQQVEFDYSSNNSNQHQVYATSLTGNLFCHGILISNQNQQIVNYLTNMPEIEGEILFFDDTTQMRNYALALDQLLVDTVLEMDELLDIVEQQFSGFVSYRTWFNETYDWLEGSFSTQEIIDLTEREFVNDEVLKTILNENRFVGIGEKVYYYHSRDVIIAVNKTNQLRIGQMEVIPDNYDVFGYGSMFLGDTTVDLISYKYVPGSGNYAKLEVNDTLSYESVLGYENVNCSVFEKLYRVWIYETWADSVGATPNTEKYEVSGTLEINWRDGTVEIIEGYEGEWLYHLYDSMGTYRPITTLTFNDRNGDEQVLEDGPGTEGEEIELIVGIACTEENASISGMQISGSGQWMMTNEVWVGNALFGDVIGSYTHAWEKQDGEWKRVKADIYTSVDGVFRDNNCTAQEEKEDSKLHHLDKKIQVLETKIWRRYDFANGDVNSHHYMVKGALYMPLDLILNPCE